MTEKMGDPTDKSTGKYSARKIKDMTAVEEAADKLKTSYCQQSSHATSDLSKYSTFKYVKLALIKKEPVTTADDVDDLTQLTLERGDDKILKRKKPINDLKEIFHYNNEPIPQLILIMGGPGIGKTTLAKEICIKWAKDSFLNENFAIVIIITLRTVQQGSVLEMVHQALIDQIGLEAYQELSEVSGEKSLIILEGLDEMADQQHQTDLIELIKPESKFNVFIKAVILVTSRPYACQGIDADRMIEIVGFGEQQIKLFVEQSFPNDSKIADKFMHKIIENPLIYSLCYVPICLVMIINIFNDRKEDLPTTLTELYKHFTIMVLVRNNNQAKFVPTMINSTENNSRILLDVHKNVEEVLSDICIPNEVKERLFLLSKLAFQSYFKICTDNPGKNKENNHDNNHDNHQYKKENNPKVIFNDNDLTQCNIIITNVRGLLKADIIQNENKNSKTYNFIHLTVQDFLCALYMLTLNEEQCRCLLEEYFNDFPNVMIFYCGLTKLDILTSVTKKLESYFSVVTAIKCLYESQKNIPLNKLLTLGLLKLDMSYNNLSPHVCYCLSYVYCHYSVSKLGLHMCNIGDTESKALAKWCLNTDKITALEEIDIANNKFTSEGMEQVIQIATSSSSLKRFDVSENEIGDDSLSTCHLLNSLIELNLEFCGLSAKGANHIKNMLITTKTLKFLSIAKNDIGDDGMTQITKALQQNKSLTHLKAFDCGFSVKGAVSISEMFKMNTTLRYLNIITNPIGDEGITVMASTTNISGICAELTLNNCKITIKGAKALAASLKENHKLKVIYLEQNDITVDGAIAILEAAIANDVCREVWIDDKYKNNDKVKEIIEKGRNFKSDMLKIRTS